MEFVGLVAASIEIGQAIIKVKEKFKLVREAPQEVTRLIDEITRVNMLLAAISKQCDLLAAYILPSPEWLLVYDFCKSATDDLLNIANSINTGIQHGRFRGSIKAVLSQKTVDAYKQRLESSKSTLLLAQSSLNILLNARQLLQTVDTQALIANVRTSRSVNAGLSPSAQSDFESRTNQQEDQSEHIVPRLSPIGLTRRLNSNYKQFCFITPTRLLGWVSEIQLWRYSQRWTIYIQTWNLREDDGLLRKLLISDDMDALRQHFGSGKAHIHDVDRNGETPLQMAFFHLKPEAAAYLLILGADIDAKLFNSRGCFDNWRYRSDIDEGDYLWLARILVQSRAEDLFDASRRTGKDIYHWNSKLVEHAESIVVNQILEYIQDRSAGYRLELACYYCAFTYPKLLHLFFPEDEWDQQLIRTRRVRTGPNADYVNLPSTIPGFLALQLGITGSIGFKIWHGTLTRCFNLDDQFYLQESLLKFVIDGVTVQFWLDRSPIYEMIHDHVNEWMEQLTLVGLLKNKMDDYIKFEYEQWANTKRDIGLIMKLPWLSKYAISSSLRLSGLHLEPEPGKSLVGIIWMDREEDDRVAEFWNLVEVANVPPIDGDNPVCKVCGCWHDIGGDLPDIPGAWIE